jgi:hypothetical protein
MLKYVCILQGGRIPMKLSLKRYLFTSLIAISTFSVGYHVNAAGQYWSGGFPSSFIKDYRYIVSGGTTTEQNDFRYAASKWNGISSKVSLSENQKGSKVSLITTTNTSEVPSAYIGYTWTYNSSGSVASTSSTWAVADVKVYKTNLSNYYPGSDYRGAFQTVAMHEIGHSLSLSHNDTVSCLMESEMRGFYTAPARADKENLKAKWGE